MNKHKTYSQEFKQELVERCRQSGQTVTSFCKLPDVPISTRTFSRWEKELIDGSNVPAERAQRTDKFEQIHLACYTLEQERTQLEEQNLSLEEMIRFQKVVYECCTQLYHLSGTEKNLRILVQVKEILS